VVTGPTGSGKSTTLAAMMDYANLHRKDHIITVEDPIEFVHQSPAISGEPSRGGAAYQVVRSGVAWCAA
jgi:type IV secretory pathway ATPase VirB11/archaellum biosynthesis ATPase